MIPQHADWEIETNPHRLLDLLGPEASRRKLRRWVCEYFRWECEFEPLRADISQALAFAEQIADDEANVDPDEWTALWSKYDAYSRVAIAGLPGVEIRLVLALGKNIHENAYRLARSFKEIRTPALNPLRLLREIFGNPFIPTDFTLWRTDNAVALARGMYNSRNFSAMPILADALQDAGCDSDEVLGHCRDPHASHVRGCWVVDGVLGLS